MVVGDKKDRYLPASLRCAQMNKHTAVENVANMIVTCTLQLQQIWPPCFALIQLIRYISSIILVAPSVGHFLKLSVWRESNQSTPQRSTKISSRCNLYNIINIAQKVQRLQRLCCKYNSESDTHLQNTAILKL